jgi:glycine/D-amino acid oxidase-like deaminating enzyme
MSVQSVPEHFPRLGASTTWAFIWEKGLDYLSQSPNADGKLYLGGGIYHNHQSNQFHDLGNSDDSTCCQTCVDRLNALPNKVFTAGKGTEIVHKWSGVMGFTSDQLPLIDKLPSDVTGKENSNDNSGGEWISAGFNGLGMNLCWLGGKGLAAMICGKTDGLERWFPVDEFACTRARLDAMDSVDMVRHIIDAPFE